VFWAPNPQPLGPEFAGRSPPAGPLALRKFQDPATFILLINNEPTVFAP
jgi:hypothetical protein